MRSAPRLIASLLLACSIGAAGCRGPSAADAVAPAECPAFIAAGRLPATVEEVAARKREGARWSNKEIRARYVCWVTRLGALDAGWKAQGISAEERSKRAYRTRHDARLTARAMMESDAEVKALQERDRAKYGHPDGPTYEWLVEKARAKGLTGDAVFEDIVVSAQRTDAATNQAFGL